MTHPGDRIAQAIGVLLSAAASLAVYFRHDDPRTLVTVLVVVPARGPALHAGPPGGARHRRFARLRSGVRAAVRRVPLTLLAVLRRELGATGSGLVLLALGLAWLADTGAYFAGRFFGRRKLYEAVSPKKTVEGALGGLLGSIVWAVVASLWFLRGALPLVHAIPLAIVAGVLGQAGDLGESLLKRSTGVKDSGAIVPGHGGVLDRVDALIVTAALVFLYAVWVERCDPADLVVWVA